MWIRIVVKDRYLPLESPPNSPYHGGLPLYAYVVNQVTGQNYRIRQQPNLSSTNQLFSILLRQPARKSMNGNTPIERSQTHGSTHCQPNHSFHHSVYNTCLCGFDTSTSHHTRQSQCVPTLAPAEIKGDGACPQRQQQGNLSSFSSCLALPFLFPGRASSVCYLWPSFYSVYRSNPSLPYRYSSQCHCEAASTSTALRSSLTKLLQCLPD